MTTDLTTTDSTRGTITKSLPPRLQTSFVLSLQDPDLLNAADDIALLISRRDDLLRRLTEENFGPGLWADLVKTFDRFKKARQQAARGSTSAAERMAQALADLEDIIAKGYHEDILWHELKDVLEQRRKLTAGEIRRRERAEEVITKEQVKTVIGFIISSIQTRVSDKDERMAILADIQNLQL